MKHGLSELGKEQARLAGRSFASDYCKRDGPTGSISALRGVAIFSSDFTRARERYIDHIESVEHCFLRCFPEITLIFLEIEYFEANLTFHIFFLSGLFFFRSIFADELAKSKIPLYNDDIILETRLRERFFGDLNGGPDTRYRDVWNIDLKDADHTEFHVESANSVLHRTTKLVLELDEILERQQSAQSKGSAKTEDSCWKCILVAHGDVLQILQTGFLRHPDASRHRNLEHLETASIRELILHE